MIWLGSDYTSNLAWILDFRAGAVLFFLSDLSVAALRLVQTDLPTYLLGLPLYYSAQVCFAVSTSQSRSQGGTPEKRSAR